MPIFLLLTSLLQESLHTVSVLPEITSRKTVLLSDSDIGIDALHTSEDKDMTYLSDAVSNHLDLDYSF